MEEAPAARKDDLEAQAAFWRRHVSIGVALHCVGCAVVFVFAYATAGVPHRVPIEVLDFVSVVASVTMVWPLGLKLVNTRWREAFFFIWSVSTIAFITTAAALDGGAHSPLSFLLVLPLLFAGLAYTPKVVAWIAALAVASSAGIGSATPHPNVDATLIMVMATAIAGMLIVAGASNRARLTDQLVELAALDSLTGCLAHRTFQRRLGEEADRTRRYGHPFALIMVDVDNLKKLNDTLGHSAGDEALLTVSSCLKAAARASDVVGRLGGDEFAVLLPETELDHVELVLERLRSSLLEHPSAKMSVPLTLSFGSTIWLGPKDSAHDMMRRADQALYAAKNTGRNCSVVWDPSLRVNPVPEAVADRGAPVPDGSAMTQGLAAPAPQGA